MSRALWSARMKGLDAGLAGEPIESCPYQDKRKLDGRITFSRAFRRAWFDGWNEATNDREQALITAKYRSPPPARKKPRKKDS